MAEHRKPPVDAVFALHAPVQRGKCRWCGEPTDERTPALGERRWWHAACELEYRVCVRADVARRAVQKRDKCICADCGRDCTNDYRARAERPQDKATGVLCWEASTRDERVYWTPIIWISLWHVDHKIPLWKVQHMPPLQRIEYFKLANLATLCERCHKRKSAKEEAEKAHFDHLAPKEKEKAKFKHRWPKGKLRSRGFPKGHRPMRRK